MADFDVIVVGARVAGSTAAIMLARQGRSVLLLDKSSFPSDTISTHIISAGGARVMARLGVPQQLERLGAASFDRMRMRGPGFEYTGALRDPTGACVPGFCLGRLKLDNAMVEYARSFDTLHFRDRCRVTDLIVEGGAVRGVRAAGFDGDQLEYRAPLTIGADGMYSIVARLAADRLGAFSASGVPCARAYYYAYFVGVKAPELDGLLAFEIGATNGSGHIACRCEDGKTVIAIAFDAAQLETFKRDLAGNFGRAVEDNPRLRVMMQGATMVSRIFSVGNLRNIYRNPVCDGAVLIGDAGLHVDPLFGQGHAFALLSAEIASELAPAWFSSSAGDVVAASAMAQFAARRDAELIPHFNASLATSRSLALDPMLVATGRAAASETWAADEMASFANFLLPPSAFPSFRLARLIVRAASAADGAHKLASQA